MNLKSVLLDEIGISRALKRISHEIIEKNRGTENIILVGIKSRGIPLAKRISENIELFEGVKVLVDHIDITLYRDDLSERSDFAVIESLPLNIDVKGKKIILVDDVLYTGRTVRAAIDGIMKKGRPEVIQLAVLVDRGHRELPIRADYVGKNVPTSKNEVIRVELKEIDNKEQVGIYDI